MLTPLTAALFAPLLLAQGGPAGPSIVQMAYIKAEAPSQYDHFGFDVAVSGNRAVIGMPLDDSGTSGVGGDPFSQARTDTGSATVYEWSGTAWSQVAYLQSQLPIDGARFGAAVAIDGDLVVVGASNNGLGEYAEVFRFNGAAWVYEATLLPKKPSPSDHFGYSVDISGQTIVVGAWREAGGGKGINPAVTDSHPNAGAAYVFDFDGVSWSQTAYIKASNTDPFDRFGHVAIDGDLLAVSATQEDSASGGVDGDESSDSLSNSGAVYVFRRTAGTWAQEAYLKAATPIADHGFGTSLAVSGETIVVGAPNDGSPAVGVGGSPTPQTKPNSGAAFVFERLPTGWSQTGYLKATNTEEVDRFGLDLAISGDLIAVGAPGEDSRSSGIGGDQSDNTVADSGAVYLYQRTGTTWAPSSYIKASNTGPGDSFGGDGFIENGGLDLDHNLLIVSANGEDSSSGGIHGVQADDSHFEAGAAYAFHLGMPCRVTNYGPGPATNPVVLGTGSTSEVGTTMVLDLQYGSVDVTALLVLAGAPASVPHFGGTLLVDWPSLLLPPPGFAFVPLVGGVGAKQLALPYGTTGISFYAQAAVLDATQPGGVALSNGLAITICP